MGLADVAFAIKLGENWSQMGNAIGLAASEQTFFSQIGLDLKCKKQKVKSMARKCAAKKSTD